MCRGTKGHCVEFRATETLSRFAPLLPPEWVFTEVAKFGDATRLAATGDIMAARKGFASLREGDARAWFVEHAQVSSHHRRRVLGTARPAAASKNRKSDTQDIVKRRVWARDHYTCRYCGLPTIPATVTKALQRVVGESTVSWGATNATKHGLALLAWTLCDHVEPASRGGANDESNLVTSCAGCNYGKHQSTVAELGIDDPRIRPPLPSNWDGLMSLLPDLNAARLA